MKRTVLLVGAFAMALAIEAQSHTKFNAGSVSDIHPAGWHETMLQRQHDGDTRIPEALERHYLNFTADELAGGIVGGRNIMSIEGILWTYGKTGNERLLQLAEEAWAIFLLLQETDSKLLLL